MGAGSFLFGSGPTFMKEGQSDRRYNNASMYGIGNRLGANFTGTGAKGAPIFDFSKVGGSIGKDEALKGYDFNPYNQAISSFQNPSLFGDKYNTSQFNFQGLPQQYANDQYALGAKDVRRESQGNLKQLNESLGPRNKGLLFKAAGNAQRAEQENLAGLNTGIRSNMAMQNAEFQKAQQLAQANENMAGFNANLGVNKANADERYRNAQALADTGGKKIAQEGDVTKTERDYKDRALEYLLDMYKTHLTTRRGAGNVAKGGLASSAINSFAQGAGAAAMA